MSSATYTYRPSFTQREQEVLGCLSEGLTTEQTADRLGIKTSSVIFHCRKMQLKAGVKSNAELLQLKANATGGKKSSVPPVAKDN